MNIIAAISQNGIIGKDNQLPWDVPRETQYFKEKTADSVMIMGRKTCESFPEPLPNRVHIVVSRSASARKGFIMCRSLQEAIERAKGFGKEIFVIGGAEIYEQAIPLVDRMYLSYIYDVYEGDTRFPKFDRTDWKIEHEAHHGEFEVVVYARKDRNLESRARVSER